MPKKILDSLRLCKHFTQYNGVFFTLMNKIVIQKQKKKSYELYLLLLGIIFIIYRQVIQKIC